MLEVCFFAKSTEHKVSIFFRIYNQRKGKYYSVRLDNFLLQNSLFHHRSEISLVTLAYLWSLLIKIVMEIQFLQVLWGTQCSICTLRILPETT